jgi:dUTPase
MKKKLNKDLSQREFTRQNEKDSYEETPNVNYMYIPAKQDPNNAIYTYDDNGLYPTHKRGFEIVKDEHRKFPDDEIKMPIRSTEHSACYDFYAYENVILSPQQRYMFWSDIKVFMQESEVFQTAIRSSLGFKKGLVLVNGIGIIDCVPKGTLIKTNDGEIEVEKLMEQKNIILSYNEELDEIEEDELTDIWTVDTYDKLIEIEIENNTVRVPEHKEVFTKRGWVKAKDLTLNDEIYIF